MARINIEDSLFKDGRFSKLCIKLGDRRLAIGALVECWILAQQNVSPDNPCGHIAAKEWSEHEMCEDIIDVKLAKRLENGLIEVTGGKDNFSWLVQKQLAAKKGGESKSFKTNNGVPNGTRTAPERVPKAAESCPLTPTLTLTPTLSLNSSSNSVSKVKKPKLGLMESDQNKRIWESYYNAYRLRYGIDPIRNAAVNSQVSKLREKVGFDTAVALVKFYLTHNKSFYLQNTHTFGHCLSDAETLRTQFLRDQKITQADVKNFEQQDHHRAQQERLRKGLA